MASDCFLPQQFQNRAPCSEASSKLNELELKAGCEVESLEDSALAKQRSEIYHYAKLLIIKISL